MIYQQGATFYPSFPAPFGVVSVGMYIKRASDNYFWDFDDSSFKAAAWTTKGQALASVDIDGKNAYTLVAGWTIPSADETYHVYYKGNAGEHFAGEVLQVGALTSLPVDATKISGSSAAADNLEASAEVIIVAAAAAGTLSTTQMTTNLTEATDDHYNGRVIIWTSGVLSGQATDITDYDGGTKMLTYTATTEAPSDADTFVIV